MSESPLKAMASHRKLKAGHFVFEFDTPGIGYILKHAGCDFTILDTEHSGFGIETVRRVMAFMRAAELPTIVRSPSRDYKDIARTLDAGADAVMLPMVSNADEAKSIIHSMKYYPAGGRGVILRSAVDRYTAGPTMEKLAAQNRRTMLVVQIENADGVENARGHRRARRGGLPVGRPLRPELLARHPRRVRPSQVRRSHRRGGRGRAAPPTPPSDGWCPTSTPASRSTSRVSTSSPIRPTPGRSAMRWRRVCPPSAPAPRAEEGAMSAFRVALSADFRKPDGSPSFPEFDLSPLEDHPDIDLVYLEPEPEISAAQLVEVDALILLAPRVDAGKPDAERAPGGGGAIRRRLRQRGPGGVQRPRRGGGDHPGRGPAAGCGVHPDPHLRVVRQALRQGPPRAPGTRRLGREDRAQRHRPGGPHPGLGRRGQHRGRDVPPCAPPRHALHRPRPLRGPGAGGGAGRHPVGPGQRCSARPTSSA